MFFLANFNISKEFVTRGQQINNVRGPATLHIRQLLSSQKPLQTLPACSSRPQNQRPYSSQNCSHKRQQHLSPPLHSNRYPWHEYCSININFSQFWLPNKITSTISIELLIIGSPEKPLQITSQSRDGSTSRGIQSSSKKLTCPQMQKYEQNKCMHRLPFHYPAVFTQHHDPDHKIMSKISKELALVKNNSIIYKEMMPHYRISSIQSPHKKLFIKEENMKVVDAILQNYRSGQSNRQIIKELGVDFPVGTYGLKIESLKCPIENTRLSASPPIINIGIKENDNKTQTLIKPIFAGTSKAIDEFEKARQSQRFRIQRRTTTTVISKQSKTKRVSTEYLVQQTQQSPEVPPLKAVQRLRTQVRQMRLSSMWSFSNNNDDLDNFTLRLRRYKQFLYFINITNDIYRQLDFESYPEPVKYYIGPGNNSNLIRSILKKRFWYSEVTNPKQANLIWTQLKVEAIYSTQPCIKYQSKIDSDKLEALESTLADTTTSTIPSIRKQRSGTRQFEPDQPLLKLVPESDLAIIKKEQHYLSRTPKSLNYEQRLHYLKKQLRTKIQLAETNYLHNHLFQNGLLGNKKALFYCLRQYHRLHESNVFDVVPYTFHIYNGTRDPEYLKFVKVFHENKKSKKRNIWIIKPGEFTNRGNGINCQDRLSGVERLVQGGGKGRTYIIQQYISRPLLYYGRKFDIRAYMLITLRGGVLKGYWYQEGYIRTSSYLFNLNSLNDKHIHLTNDAVQKYTDDYGKYEDGNKLSYQDIHRYILAQKKVDFFKVAYPKMKKIAIQAIKATSLFLDPEGHQDNFELFGLDFMLDDNVKPWLLEINTNPCLQLSSALLQRLIPLMVENVFRIAVDPVFPPPDNFPSNKKYHTSENPVLYNRFELVYDSLRDRAALATKYEGTKLMQEIGKAPEDQETYQDDGSPIDVEETN